MRKMSKEEFFKSFKNQSFVNQLKAIPQKFNVVHNEETKTSELTIYGVIGDSWWEESISASDIDKALRDAGDNDIVIHLNSPGGDAFDGITIANRLKNHKGHVKVIVDGYACSAASLLPPVADEVVMGIGSMLMIHEASTIVWGTKKDMRKEADVLEKLEDGIIDIYMEKANVSREKIREMVDAETWFSANEAMEIGFATSTSSSTVEENEDEEITQLKTQIKQMQSELEQFKNQNQNEPPNPAPTQARKGFIF